MNTLLYWLSSGHVWLRDLEWTTVFELKRRLTLNYSIFEVKWLLLERAEIQKIFGVMVGGNYVCVNISLQTKLRLSKRPLILKSKL